MWKLIAEIILKCRLVLIIIIGAITAFMGYHLQFIEISYDLASVVPEDDTEMINLQAFKELFGEDGNIMAIGVQDSSLFELKNFNRFRTLADELKDLNLFNNELDTITLIEWPQIIIEKPKQLIELNFEYANDYQKRSVQIKGLSL